jgi:diguanylate cyclase (GGDEF)-like protein
MAKNKTVVTVISKISERAAAQTAALVVIYGQDLGRKFDLGGPTAVIGRSSRSDIRIDQDSISRNHARLSLDAKVATIADMGSTNGTFVNDEPVAGTRTLQNGDFIKIGRTIFKYIAGGNIEGLYHEEIYKLTTTDGLTQIYNKRYLLEMLDREISRCHRYSRELSLVMLDLDYFKLVNDTFGHLAGDHVLRQVAQVIRAHIRREDVFARYGGEEFALILPEIDAVHATLTADKARKLVERQRLTFEGAKLPVTLSCGVAALHGEKLSTQELIKRADAKLYEAKQAGRNRVCS